MDVQLKLSDRLPTTEITERLRERETETETDRLQLVILQCSYIATV